MNGSINEWLQQLRMLNTLLQISSIAFFMLAASDVVLEGIKFGQIFCSNG